MPWNRRDFVRLGIASTAAVTVGCATAARTSDRPRFRTRLCDLLRVDYPIIQSGMGGVAGAELAAAVSRAGALGIIAGAFVAPDELRRRIRQARQLTDRPIGVNLLLNPQVVPPVDAAGIPETVIRAVHGVLNRFRERLGLPASTARPATLQNDVPDAIEVILEERVPVFSIGLGRPERSLVDRFHANGAVVIAMASTVDDARELDGSGVDAIVVQGHEAGGHRSTWVKRPTPEHAHIGTIALVPQVFDAVRAPVIAAGGIANGRGVVAAMALGAAGALLGTRFVATRESAAVDFYKQALVDRDSDSTTVTDAFSGLYARVLRNTYTTEYAASDAPVLPGYLQSAAARDITTKARDTKNVEYFPMWAGQSVGMIRNLPGAEEVVASLVHEARLALRALPDLLQA